MSTLRKLCVPFLAPWFLFEVWGSGFRENLPAITWDEAVTAWVEHGSLDA
jgi:hypothetical protein